MGNRPFEFDTKTQLDAYNRQGGRCGICGQYLWKEPFNLYQAHHIEAARFNKTGITGKGGSINGLDNCVILCMERKDGTDGCHLYAHGDDYRRPFELVLPQYLYFNG